MGHSRRIATLCLVVASALMLVSCGELQCDCPPADKPPNLSMSNVHIVSTLTPTLEATATASNDNGILEGITPYVYVAGRTRALVTIDQTLYSLDVTSSSVSRVDGISCVGPAALSPDHTLVACPTDAAWAGGGCGAYCAGLDLTLAYLSSDTHPTATMLQTVAGEFAHSSPTWLPTGRYLFALHRPAAGGSADDCGIDIFDVSQTNPLTRTASLELPTGDTCEVRQIAWSPDGKALALLTSDSLALLSASDIPARAYVLTAQPPSIPVTPTTIARGLQMADWMAWTSDGEAITLLDNDQLLQVSMPSGQQYALLAPPSDESVLWGLIGAFAWLPTGKQLLFAFGEREAPPSTYPGYDDAASAVVPSMCFCKQSPSASTCTLLRKFAIPGASCFTPTSDPCVSDRMPGGTGLAPTAARWLAA